MRHSHQLQRLETKTFLGCAALLFFASLAIFVMEEAAVRLNLLLQMGLLIGAGSWSKRRSGTLLNPPFVVLTAIFLWHSPLLIECSFFSDFAGAGNTFNYGKAYVPDTVALISACMAFLSFGMIIAYQLQASEIIPNASQASNTNIANTLGWAIFGIFFLLTLAYLISEGGSLDDDYMSMYLNPSSTAINRVFQSVKQFGVLSILILFYSSKNKKAVFAAIAASLALTMVVFLFGSRSMPFLYAFTVLVCIDKYLLKIRAWQLVIILVGASALSFIIDHTRAFGLGMNLLKFEQTERSVDLTHIFGNMGGTVTNILRTMEFVEGDAPLLGYSFVEPLLFILPRPLMEAAGIHAIGFRPSEWIINYSSDVPEGGGLGYSLVAEAYLNFRMFGSGIFLFIGWIISRNCFNHSPNHRRVSDILILNFVILLTLNMRNDWAGYCRILFWSYMLMVFIGSYRKNSGSSSTGGD